MIPRLFHTNNAVIDGKNLYKAGSNIADSASADRALFGKKKDHNYNFFAHYLYLHVYVVIALGFQRCLSCLFNCFASSVLLLWLLKSPMLAK